MEYKNTLDDEYQIEIDDVDEDGGVVHGRVYYQGEYGEDSISFTCYPDAGEVEFLTFRGGLPTVVIENCDEMVREIIDSAYAYIDGDDVVYDGYDSEGNYEIDPLDGLI